MLIVPSWWPWSRGGNLSCAATVVLAAGLVCGTAWDREELKAFLTVSAHLSIEQYVGQVLGWKMMAIVNILNIV